MGRKRRVTSGVKRRSARRLSSLRKKRKTQTRRLNKVITGSKPRRQPSTAPQSYNQPARVPQSSNQPSTAQQATRRAAKLAGKVAATQARINNAKQNLNRVTPQAVDQKAIDQAKITKNSLKPIIKQLQSQKNLTKQEQQMLQGAKKNFREANNVIRSNFIPGKKAFQNTGSFTKINNQGRTISVSPAKAVGKNGNLRKGFSYDAGKAFNKEDLTRLQLSGLSQKQQKKIIDSPENRSNFGNSFGKSDITRMQQSGMSQQQIAAYIQSNPNAKKSVAGKKAISKADGQFNGDQYNYGNKFDNQDVKKMKAKGMSKQDIAKYVNANDINNKVGKRFQFKINPNNVGPNQPDPNLTLDPAPTLEPAPTPTPEPAPTPDPALTPAPDPLQWYRDQIADLNDKVSELEGAPNGGDIPPPNAEENDPGGELPITAPAPAPAPTPAPAPAPTPGPAPAPTNPEIDFDNLTPEQIEKFKEALGIQDIVVQPTPTPDSTFNPEPERPPVPSLAPIEPEGLDYDAIDDDDFDDWDQINSPTPTPTDSRFFPEPERTPVPTENIPFVNTETSSFGSFTGIKNVNDPQNDPGQKFLKEYMGDPKEVGIGDFMKNQNKGNFNYGLNADYTTLDIPTISTTPSSEYKTIDTYQPSNKPKNQPKVANDFVKSGSPKIQPLNPFTGLPYNLDASTGLTANPLQEMYSTIPGQLTSQGTIKGGYQPYVPEVPNIQAPTVNDVTVPTIPYPTQSPYQTQFEKDGMGYLPGQAGSKLKKDQDKYKFGSNYDNLVGNYNFINNSV